MDDRNSTAFFNIIKELILVDEMECEINMANYTLMSRMNRDGGRKRWVLLTSIEMSSMMSIVYKTDTTMDTIQSSRRARPDKFTFVMFSMSLMENAKSQSNVILPLPTVLENRNKMESGCISLLKPYSASKMFFPVLPNPILNLNGSKWLSESPLRQRGLRLRPEQDPHSFVTCQLCGNRILANREINLENHARRHSTLKQFQCCYCEYTHSEITKVRLHMAHNHNDTKSRPINNLNAEMRQSWRALIHDCFPYHPFVVNDKIKQRYTQFSMAAAAFQFENLKGNVEFAQNIRFQPY